MESSKFLRLKNGCKVQIEGNDGCGLFLVFTFKEFIPPRSPRKQSSQCIITTDVMHLHEIDPHGKKNAFTEVDNRRIRWNVIRPGWRIKHIDTGFIFTVVHLDAEKIPFLVCIVNAHAREIEMYSDRHKLEECA